MKALAAVLALLLAAPSALPGDEKPKAVVAKPRPAPRSKKEALKFLERTTISVDFDGTPLADAVAHVSALAEVNILIGPALRAEGGLDARKVTLRLRKVTTRQALEFVAGGQDLGIGFVSGVLTVTTRKEARGKPVLRLHALGDLLMPLTDFPAPDLVLRPAGAERVVGEETSRKPAFGDADEAIDLIRRTVGEGTWEEEGVSLSVMGEFLVVNQYEEFQDEVGRLLALLRSCR
jgi:hypothetical protein